MKQILLYPEVGVLGWWARGDGRGMDLTSTGEKNPFFCILPWTSLYVIHDGKVHPCCRALRAPALGNLHDQSVEEVVNSPEMRELRLAMLDGRPSAGCTECYDIEKNGERSVRQEYLFRHDRYLPLAERTAEDGSVEGFVPVYLNLSLSNRCQLKCRSCNPFNSSSWQSERGMPEGYRALDESSAKEKLISLIRDNRSIEAISFSGGEPLISGFHYEVLDILLAQRRTGTHLLYNTNLVQLRWKGFDITDYWNRFERVTAYISIDGTGKRFDYVRTGHSWERLLENLGTLRQRCRRVDAYAMVTYSMYNFLYLPEMLDTFLEEKIFPIDRIFFILLHEPAHLRPQNASPELKSAAKAKYYAYMKKLLTRYDLNEAVLLIRPMKMLLRFLEQGSSSPGEFKAFSEFNSGHADPRLSGSFSGLFPELT